MASECIPLVTEDIGALRDAAPPETAQDLSSKSISIAVKMKRFVVVVPVVACLVLLVFIMQEGGNRQSKLSPTGEYHISYDALRSVTLNSLQSAPVAVGTKPVDPNHVHLCSAVIGAGAVTEFEMFLSTLQKQRVVDWHTVALSLMPDYAFHCVTDSDSQALLADAFKRTGFESYELHILDEAGILKELDNMKVKLSHGYGVAAVSKSFSYDIFANVSRCVLLDTDLFAAQPLVDLYMQIDAFDSKEVVGATWRPFMPFGDRINTGVVLQDFQKMRERGWADAMGNVFDSLRIGGSIFDNGYMVLNWADQDLMHAALMSLSNETDPTAKPQGLHPIDYGWNLEMCRQFWDGCNHSFIGLLHFNCGRRVGDKTIAETWWTSERYEHNKTIVEKCVQGLP